MKLFKYLSLILLAAMTLVGCRMDAAESTNAVFPHTFINGTLGINYAARVQSGQAGVPNTYTLFANVNNSVLFNGTIKEFPRIASVGVLRTTLSQTGKISFDIACDVINQKQTNQTRNIGKIFGDATINDKNIYLYDSGNVRMIVVNQQKESFFRGFTLGKPPVKKLTSVEQLTQQAKTLTKNINGKAIKISIPKYDKMGFQSFVLAGGPVPIYPEATVNGDMFYDYARSAWHFENVSILYAVDKGNGQRFRMEDKLSGNIRWIEKTGEYEFDVRVNEPPPSESAAFEAPSDENAFFETDSSIPALMGKMKYKDSKNGDVVTSSQVTIELVGNRLTKQQTMNLFKLIILGAIVPFNAE